MGERVEKTVVVLGMHRSGTSLVAGILERLGVDMGKKQVGVHWSNPLGHYENIDFVKMDDRVLEKLGGSWDDPPEVAEVEKLYSDERLNKEIKETVESNKGSLWGWKVPTTSLTMELYLPYLDNPHFIICHRPPEDIVRSFQKRDETNPEKVRELIDVYNNSIDQFLNNHPDLKVIELKYNEMLENPHEEIQKIVEFLGIDPSQEQVQDALAFVLPRDKVEELQTDLKKKEWQYLLRDMVKNPYLVRRYAFKALRSPKYALKKLGLR